MSRRNQSEPVCPCCEESPWWVCGYSNPGGEIDEYGCHCFHTSDIGHDADAVREWTQWAESWCEESYDREQCECQWR